MWDIMRVSFGKSRRAEGFTLIELMVVVAIIALLAAAVAPTFGMTLLRGRQREAGNLLVQAVFAAKSRAARTGRCHRVRVRLSNPGLHGGFGGAVAVDESPFSSCSRPVAAPNNWNRLSYKSVMASGENAGDVMPAQRNTTHVTLIDRDVAIYKVRAVDHALLTDVNGVENMLFDPTSGGLFDLMERYFVILAYTGDSANGGEFTGVRQVVRVSPGGAVSYSLPPAGWSGFATE